MPWSEIIDSYTIHHPKMRLSYGNRRFDSRAINVLRKMGKELDVNIRDTQVDVPSLYHNVVVLDLERLEGILEPFNYGGV